MSLISPQFIKDLLEKHGAKPSSFLGQNFLVHAPTLDHIIEVANLQEGDTVLEIGPGLGTLTQELAKKVKKVIAVEKDRVMLGILRETLKEYKNIELIEGDALTHPVPTGDYKVVANIPYYLTSALIRKLLEDHNPPSLIILMIQKEVAERICAKPPHMSILAVSVQFYAAAKIVGKAPKGHFWPSPKIDSSIISITPFARAQGKPPVDPEAFFQIVKAGFVQPRKQLGNNFSKTLKRSPEEINAWLAQNNIRPEQRAETLSIQDWTNLVQTLR